MVVLVEMLVVVVISVVVTGGTEVAGAVVEVVLGWKKQLLTVSLYSFTLVSS